MTLQALERLDDALRSRFVSDSETLERFSRDFSRLSTRVPALVARPRNVTELVEIVSWASREKVPLAIRGSGHSQAGQTLVASGVIVDMRELRRVSDVDVDAGRVEVECGATWASVVEKTLPLGVAPRVLTSEHSTTVGGTLSVGGLGSTSFRYGAQVDNVEYLDVVVGTGALCRCSRSENQEIFDAVRAGLGQFGVIARAGIALRSVKRRLRTYTFAYDAVTPFMEDLKTVVDSSEATHVLAHFAKPEGNERPGLRLTVGIEHDGGTEPELAVLARPRCRETLPTRNTDTFGENHIFYFRYADWFSVSEATVYPWVDHFFDWDAAQRCLSAIMTGRFTPLLKLGVSTIIPVASSPDSPPLMARRKDARPLLLIGLFPALPAGLADLAEVVVSYRNWVEQEFGARRYLYGYAGPTPSWRDELIELWPHLRSLKQRLDPADVFNPELLKLQG